MLGNGPISLEGALSSDGVRVDHKLRAVKCPEGTIDVVNSAPSQPAASPVCRGHLVVSLATQEGPLTVLLLFACKRT